MVLLHKIITTLIATTKRTKIRVYNQKQQQVIQLHVVEYKLIVVDLSLPMLPLTVPKSMGLLMGLLFSAR